MGPSLPPELIDLVILHLPDNSEQTLKNCALVARTWSGPSQRALFHHIDLSKYSIMTKLLVHLICFPHLQTLIRGLTIHQHSNYDDIPFPAHMSCLTSLLSLLPSLMGFEFTDDSDDDIVVTRSYLDLIPNVLGNAPLVELDIDVYSVETFQHVFGILGGTNVKRVSLFGFVGRHAVDLGVPRKRLHLPSLEHICFGVEGLQKEFHNCLMHKFDLPNLKQCEIILEFAQGFVHWQDVLRRGFLPLELFKLELAKGFTDDLKYHIDITDDAFRPLCLAGLPFQHIHLSVSADRDQTHKFIEWWSSTFRALSDSKATIHFTELTFSCTYLQDIDALEEAWIGLDNILAHTAFSGVRSIHFKGIDWKSEFATQVAHPILEDRMRLVTVLPRLTSQGVLCFD